jgi:hypothetical protein
MRKVALSVIAQEQLQELLSGGMDRESNIVSALVETVTGWWCKSCWRPSKPTFWMAGAAISAISAARRASAARATGTSRPGFAPPRVRADHFRAPRRPQ